MRARDWSARDVAQVIASEDGWISRDDRGNIMVVLARDAIDFVITIYGERGRRR